nr:MAG TPA: hypothetical protein [Caudoviricetes sp.]
MRKERLSVSQRWLLILALMLLVTTWSYIRGFINESV